MRIQRENDGGEPERTAYAPRIGSAFRARSGPGFGPGFRARSAPILTPSSPSVRPLGSLHCGVVRDRFGRVHPAPRRVPRRRPNGSRLYGSTRLFRSSPDRQKPRSPRWQLAQHHEPPPRRVPTSRGSVACPLEGSASTSYACARERSGRSSSRKRDDAQRRNEVGATCSGWTKPSSGSRTRTSVAKICSMGTPGARHDGSSRTSTEGGLHLRCGARRRARRAR